MPVGPEKYILNVNLNLWEKITTTLFHGTYEILPNIFHYNGN